MNYALLRALVVDDSLIFRKIITDLLCEIPDVEIIGQATNGRIALEKLVDQKPDLVIMDIDMPELNGLEVLEQIRVRKLNCGVIMVSGFWPDMTLAAVKALNAGAFEFVRKPSCDTIEETRRMMENDLKMAVTAFMEHSRVKGLAASGAQKMPEKMAARSSSGVSGQMAAIQLNKACKPASGIADLLIIGISTGGPPALTEIFSRLSEPLEIPAIIIQHIPACFSEALATSIGEKSGLQVYEAKDGMPLEPGQVFLSPGGCHVRLARCLEKDRYILRLSDDPPENSCRPSVDYLLRSAVKCFSGRIAFLIMTGMGSDGLNGARMVRDAGGYVIAQSGDSCVVFGMPRAVIEAGLADEVVHIKDIPECMQRVARRGKHGNLSGKVTSSPDGEGK